MTVLVLSEDCDPTVDRVVQELAARDVPVFRCDTGWFPRRLTMDADLGADGWTGRLISEHREVRLEDVRSVWSRRPSAFSFSDALSGPERRHAAWEAKLGVGGVLTSLPALWVNPPSSDADCSYKPRQLTVAQRSGLAVPPTVITNQEDAVRRFATERDDQVVVKRLSCSSVTEQGGTKPVFTHVLAAQELRDLRGVEVTAHLFQRYIVDKAFEARVTVVGDRIFASAIHAGSEESRVDWRSDYASLTYEVVEVPDHVADGLLAFMAEFNLMFGAFDLAIDTRGTWWWFECNAAGQFAFIEAQTGLPITDALVDLLEKGQP